MQFMEIWSSLFIHLFWIFIPTIIEPFSSITKMNEWYTLLTWNVRQSFTAMNLLYEVIFIFITCETILSSRFSSNLLDFTIRSVQFLFRI